MSQDKEYSEYAPEHNSGAPRWIGVAIAALAILSIAGIGAAVKATSHANQADTERAALASDVKSMQQSLDAVSQRLKQSEDSSAEMQGELKVVTGKLKLTQGELARARSQAKQAREEYTKQLSDMETNVKSELATKASSDDVKNLSGDVTNVKSDLDSTKQNLQMAKGELGTLIARNHEEIEQLRRLGQRDYFEFTLKRKSAPEKVGPIQVELRGTNPKRNQFSATLFVDDSRYEKRNRSANEPIYFYSGGARAPLEMVVNKVTKDQIAGYVSVPKVASPSAGK